MVNYGKSKIYKIQKIGGDSEIYIGSTTKDYLSQRMEYHRSRYKRWRHWIGGTTDFITSFKLFDLYGLKNCEIVLLENVNCNSKDELKARVGLHIQANNCVNKHFKKDKHIKLLEKQKEETLLEKIKKQNKNKDIYSITIDI